MDKKNRLSDEEYKYVFERVPRLCLDFVVVKNNEFLLARRNIEPSKGLWALPGGMMRKGEAVSQAAARILEEEIGLKRFHMDMIGYIEFLGEINQNGTKVHSVSIAFLVNPLKGENISAESQAEEIRFFKKVPQDINFKHKEFLKKNIRKISK